MAGVGLGKELSAEAADVFDVENEVAWELTLHAERVYVSKGRPEIGIDGVVELAFRVAEGNTVVDEWGQRMGYRLRSVGHRKSAECRKTRVGGQVAKIGVGASIKQVGNLVLNKVYGIGVNAVVDHGGAATDDGFLIAQNSAEQTVFRLLG